MHSFQHIAHLSYKDDHFWCGGGRWEMMWGVCNMHIHLCGRAKCIDASWMSWIECPECPELNVLQNVLNCNFCCPFFFCNSAKHVSGLDQEKLFSNNLFDCFRTKVIKINCFRTGTMSATVAGLFAQGQFTQKIKREKT